MRRLFRSFDRFGVDVLLISGQATILYGAATFSEDVDVWIRPTRRNALRFLRALAACRARVHRLTPPLEERFLERGHGFHFLVPETSGPVYLDVMGRPPRVASFDACLKRSRRFETPWGPIQVVGIEDLVRLKKTRRLMDYDVISNLVDLRVAQEERPSNRLLRWAAENSFRAEARAVYLRRLGRPAGEARCRRAISRDLATLQARDTAYWRRIVRELRRLRRLGKLLPDGRPVASL